MLRTLSLFISLALITVLLGTCGTGVHPTTETGGFPNVPMNILAGTLDSGLGGSAQNALFLNHVGYFSGVSENDTPNDPGSFIVTSDRTVYFRDRVRGLLMVNSSDGLQKLLIPTTGVRTGDGGPVANASLKDPIRIALDYSGGILIHDYDRIRRVDTNVTPMTINTIIGGGSSTEDSVGPLQVSFVYPGTSFTPRRALPLVALPNGDIYFQSDQFYGPSGILNPRTRIYHAATNLVTSLTPSGTGYNVSSSTELSTCTVFGPGIAFNPTTSAITAFISTVYSPCSLGSVNLNPNSGAATAPHPTDPDSAAYRVSEISSRKGDLYAISRHNSYLKKYTVSSGAWTTLLGKGVQGSCLDGTAALSCNVDISDAFVADDDTVYFLDRGKVRYITSNGQVATLMGHSMSYGDNGPATSARFNVVNSIDQTASGEILVLDQQEVNLRSFTIGGNIQTIAGNGITGSTTTANIDTTLAATTQPLRMDSNGVYWDDFKVEPDSGDVYYGIKTKSPAKLCVGKLSRTTGKWSCFVGSGATNYFDTAGDGSLGSAISIPIYPPRVLGFDGARLLVLHQNYDSTLTRLVASMLKLYTLTNGTQSSFAGTTGASGYYFGADEVDGTSAEVPSSYGFPIPRATWDSVTGRWVFIAPHTSVVRKLTPGGKMGTLAQLATTARSLAYVRKDGNEFIYYCDDLGRLRKNDLHSDIALPWPGATSFCSGKTLLYNSARNSLIFPFIKDGVQAIAEYPNP